VPRRLKTPGSPSKAFSAPQAPTPQAKPKRRLKGQSGASNRRLAKPGQAAGAGQGRLAREAVDSRLPLTAVEAERKMAKKSIVVVGYRMTVSQDAWCAECYREISVQNNGYPKELVGAGWAMTLYESSKRQQQCRSCKKKFFGETNRD